MRRPRPVLRWLALPVFGVLGVLAGCSAGRAAPGDPGELGQAPPTTPTEVSPGGTMPVPPGRPVRYAEVITGAVDRHLDVAYAEVAALRTGAPLTVRLDWFEPRDDRESRRPVIVWIHGGGFFQGARADVRDVAEAWAKRGFVTATIDYRLDPGSKCMQLEALAGAERTTEAKRCNDAMVAAMHDAQGAVRWVRANAAALRADPDRVAVGGFSAGALTAVHVAQRADDPGDVGTARNERSSVSAAIAASGCSAELSTIDAGDAPVFLVASELDRSVPFACTVATERRTASVGTPAVTRYYLGESGHALGLYRQHRDEIDRAWAAFLIERLRLA
jgi:acetyl esterase/lipase